MRRRNPGRATPAVLRELLAVAGDAAEELGSPLTGLLRALAEEPDIDTVREYAHGVETEEFQTLARGLAEEALKNAEGIFEEADFDAGIDSTMRRCLADDLVHIIAQSPAVKPDRHGKFDRFRVMDRGYMDRPAHFTRLLLDLANTTLHGAVLTAAQNVVIEQFVEEEHERRQGRSG